MTSYPALTFPRKNKRPAKEKAIAPTGDPESEQMYSTLSKRPADLQTTDIECSAIRVFMTDGSHRTLSCTPEATCREILDRLLRKLGLTEHSNEYALQIKYARSEPRIANDGELISKLNVHAWDSVDRIYLYKKDVGNVSTPPLPRRKRLAFLSRVMEQEGSFSDSCAVTDKHMVERESVHTREPVLVNKQLACRFARAWSVGSEKQQAGESGGQKPMTNAIVFKPVPVHHEEAGPNVSPKMEQKNAYTPDHRPKDSTIRRRPPVSPRRMPESFTPSPETPKPSLRGFMKRANSQEDLTNDSHSPTPSHFSLHLLASPAFSPVSPRKRIPESFTALQETLKKSLRGFPKRTKSQENLMMDSSTLTPSHFSHRVPLTSVFSPVSPRRATESCISLKEMPKRSPMRFPKRAKSQEDLIRENSTLTASHSSLQLPTWKSPAVSPLSTLGHSFRDPSELPSPSCEQPLLFEGDNKGESTQSPNHKFPANDEDVSPVVQKESDNMPKFLVKTRSEASLLSGLKSESDKNLSRTLSQEILRDSGFHDGHSPSGSVSSLARFAHKAPVIRTNSENLPAASNPGSTEDMSSTREGDLLASTLTELPTNDGLDMIREIAMSVVDTSQEVPQNTKSKPLPIPPPIPDRSSAYVHNCTIPDEDLLRQGKRISHMLQLTPKKEEREHKSLRTLHAAFGRISTLLRKGKQSPESLSNSFTSPTSGRRGLGFPDSPVSSRAKMHPGVDSPPKKPAEINSLGVRMSQVEYAEVNIGEKQNRSLDWSKSGFTTLAVAGRPRAGSSPMTSLSSYDVASPSSYDVATPSPSSSGKRIGERSTTIDSRPLNAQQGQSSKLPVSGTDLEKGSKTLEDKLQEFSHTVPRSRPQVLPGKRRTVVEDYDIAVPIKIPQREHHYLTVVIETPPTSPQHGKPPPSEYENNVLQMTKSSSCFRLDGRDMHVYNTPKPQPVSHASTATGAHGCMSKYENQGIQNGANGGIDYGNSPLHVYNAVAPPSKSKLPENKYENNTLEMKSSSCIQLDGSDSHIYNTPNPQSVTHDDGVCGPPARYIYENQGVQNGPISEVDFGNSPLHTYDAVTSSSSNGCPKSGSIKMAYENNNINPSSSGGIAFGGQDLHVYQVPPAEGHPLPPPPPLPPQKQLTPKDTSKPKISLLPPKPPTQHQTSCPQMQQKSDSNGPTPLHSKPEVVGQPSSSGHTTVEPQKQIPSKDTSKSKIPLLPPKPHTSQDLLASSSAPPSEPYYNQTKYCKLWDVIRPPEFTPPPPPLVSSDADLALLPTDTGSDIYEPIPDLQAVVDTGAPPPIPPLPLEIPGYSTLSFSPPLPPVPMLSPDSDSDDYDTIASPPSSDDEYEDILPARVPITPEHSLPLKPKKVESKPPKVAAKPKSHPAPNVTAGQKIVLSEASKSADGKTYKSWTSSNAIENPRGELQSKLKRRLNIIQAQLSKENSTSSPTSSSTMQPESQTSWNSNSEPARDGNEVFGSRTPSPL